MAAFALMGMYGEAVGACESLRVCLDDEEDGVRLAAARALYAIDGEVEGPLATNVRILCSGNAPKHRATAAYNIGLMGADGLSAATDLEMAAHDSDPEVREQVQQAIRAVEVSRR
jgi:HEAT repeat protein